MRAFQREPGGHITASIDRDEALLLQSLAGQLATVLHTPSDVDPAVLRLLPDAYPDDAEASSEFRRLTESGLRERKLANADTLMTTLSESVETGELRLDSTQAAAWLRSLTDLRLTLANRLGIESDDGNDESGNPDSADTDSTSDDILQDLYDWLGYLQNSLVEAVDV